MRVYCSRTEYLVVQWGDVGPGRSQTGLSVWSGVSVISSPPPPTPTTLLHGLGYGQTGQSSEEQLNQFYRQELRG